VARVTESPVEFAGAPRRAEAVRSLASAWNVTETRAAALLDDPVAYERELARLARRGMTVRERLRVMERRYPAPGMLP
jgi:hypothetical protein